MKNKTTGFTLVELMVAVAIVAILASVAYPSYKSSVQKSHRAQAKSDLLELTQQLERWYTVNSSYASYPTLEGTAQAHSPTSGTPYYDITLDAPGPTTYTLTATAVGTQADDICGNLSISNTGLKSSTGGTIDQCW